MIGLEQPWALVLLVPVLVLAVGFARIQHRAVAWIEAHVNPVFRATLTVHDRRSLGRHLLLILLMASALVVAAARPYLPGRTQAVAVAGRLLMLVDASPSMYANDVTMVGADGQELQSRIAVARHIAGDLAGRLDDFELALASFSGAAVIHLPMVRDRQILQDALAVLETHSYYRNTGSDLPAALDLVSHFIDPRAPDLQVVILSDGEMPVAADYGQTLAALASQAVPIHGVGIGSSTGQKRVIYDFADIVAKKEEPRVLRRFTTRRDDSHLAAISKATGGLYALASDSAPGEIVRAIARARGQARTIEDEAARTDLARLPLALFVVLFLIDSLWIGRRLGRRSFAFDIDRIARRPRAREATSAAARARPVVTAALLTLLGLAGLATSCGDLPREIAHRENELGITRDALRLHAAARPHYERSRGIGIESEIPTHNLARSVSLAGDYSDAHRLFQEALELDPELVSAHHNDGVALYLWGAAERDPRECELERTRELWQSAQSRFASAAALAGSRSEIGADARRNLRFLAGEIARLERLIETPPEHCRGPGGGGGGGDDGSGGGPPQAGGGDGGGQNDSRSGGDGSEDGPDGGEPADGDSPGGGPDGDQPADAEPADGDPPPPGSGGPEPPPGDSPEESEGGGGLSPSELDAIAAALERISQQGLEPGKFHRRTHPEQFRKEDWARPDAVIWW